MALVLDILIIVLIAIMIGYSVVLNNKLKSFRNAQNEMAGLVGQLNQAINNAQASVDALRKAANEEEGKLDALIRKARLMSDELEFITETGSNLANRIEKGLVPDENTSPDMAAKNDEYEDAETAAEEENEMLETLKRVR